MSGKLTEDGLQVLLEDKDHYADDMLFPSVEESIDRHIEFEEN